MKFKKIITLKFLPILLSVFTLFLSCIAHSQAHIDSLETDTLLKIEWFQSAVVAYEAGNDLDVIQILTPYIASNKKNAAAYGYLGSSTFQHADMFLALEYFDKAIALGTHDVRWYAERAIINSELLEYEKAILDLDFVIANSNASTIIYLERGMMLSLLERQQDALSDFNKAIELDNQNAAAWYMRGSVLQEIEDYRAAIIDYEQYQKMETVDADFFLNLAFCKNENGDYQSAIVDLSKCLELKGDSTQTYFEFGRAFLGMSNYKEAVTMFSKHLTREHQFADAYYMRGLAYMQMRENELALQDWERALEIYPEYLEPIIAIGKLEMEEKEYDRAIKYFTQALFYEDQMTLEMKTQTLNNRGTCLLQKESYVKAIEDLSVALIHNPKNMEFLLKRAEVYLQKADKHADNNGKKEALENYQNAHIDLIAAQNISPDNFAIKQMIRDVEKKIKKLE